jgi:hypothetical protein
MAIGAITMRPDARIAATVSEVRAWLMLLAACAGRVLLLEPLPLAELKMLGDSAPLRPCGAVPTPAAGDCDTSAAPVCSDKPPL